MNLPEEISKKLNPQKLNEFIQSFDRGRLAVFTQYITSLKEMGTNFNAINASGETLLHNFALDPEKAPLIETLAEHIEGLDANRKNREGSSPMHYAVMKGNEKGLKSLASIGAEVDIQDDSGKNLFHLCFIHRHTCLIPQLKALGVSLQQADSLGCTPIFYAVKSYAFDFECPKKQVEYLNKIKSHGIPINFNVKDGKGRTLLHHVTIQKKESHLPSLVKEGAFVDAQDKKGDTSLMLATQMGYIPALKVLVEQGGRLEMRNAQGFTCLQLAVIEENLQTLPALLDLGAQIEGTNSLGMTSLHVAIAEGKEKALNFLLEHNINPQSVDEKGRNAWHYCCLLGRSEMFERLSSCSIDASAPDGRGNLPLHYAAMKGNSFLVKTLLNKVKNPFHLNQDNLSPLDLAILNNFEGVADLIPQGRKSSSSLLLKMLLSFTELAPEVEHSLPLMNKKMLQCFSTFKEKVSHKNLNQEEWQRLEALFSTLDFPPDSSELLAYYKQHKVLLLPSGWEGECCLVGFIDDFLILSSVREGGREEKSIDITHFNPLKLKEELISKTLQVFQSSSSEAKEWLYGELKVLLEAKASKLPRPLKLGFFFPPLQEAGSGIFGALKAMDYAASGLLCFIRRNDLTDNLSQHQKEWALRPFILTFETFQQYVELHLPNYQAPLEEKIHLLSSLDVKALNKIWMQLKKMLKRFDFPSDPIDQFAHEAFETLEKLWQELLEKGDDYRQDLFAQGIQSSDEALQLKCLKGLLEYAKISFPHSILNQLIQCLEKGPLKVKVFTLEILALVNKTGIEQVVEAIIPLLYQEVTTLQQAGLRCIKKIGPMAMTILVRDAEKREGRQRERGVALLKEMGLNENAIKQVMERSKNHKRS